jgi:hypothetical protein
LTAFSRLKFCADVFTRFRNSLLDKPTNEGKGVIQEFSRGVDCLLDVIRIISWLIGNVLTMRFYLIPDTGIIHGSGVIG